MNKQLKLTGTLILIVMALGSCSKDSDFQRFLAQFGFESQGSGTREMTTLGSVTLPIFEDGENSTIAARYREFTSGNNLVVDRNWLQRSGRVEMGVYVLPISEHSHAVVTQSDREGDLSTTGVTVQGFCLDAKNSKRYFEFSMTSAEFIRNIQPVSSFKCGSRR